MTTQRAANERVYRVAGRRYTTLRRTYWSLILLTAAIGAASFIFVPSPDPEKPSGAKLVHLVLAFGAAGCVVVAVAVWTAILFFRCPRCGQRVVVAAGPRLLQANTWPTDQCKSCHLYLGTAGGARE